MNFYVNYSDLKKKQASKKVRPSQRPEYSKPLPPKDKKDADQNNQQKTD